MLEWLSNVHRVCRGIRVAAAGASRELSLGDDGDLQSVHEHKGYLKAAIVNLEAALPSDFPPSRLGDLKRHIAFGDAVDFHDIVMHDLPNIEEKAEEYALRNDHTAPAGFEALLHPVVSEVALAPYKSGDYRYAVFEAVIAVFDLIRDRTGLDLDGDALATQAFSVHNPLLVIADLSTETGRSEQIGMMQMCQGAYKNIRNPKAHTRSHNLNAHTAAQNLTFLSLLARLTSQASQANQHGD